MFDESCFIYKLNLPAKAVGEDVSNNLKQLIRLLKSVTDYTPQFGTPTSDPVDCMLAKMTNLIKLKTQLEVKAKAEAKVKVKVKAKTQEDNSSKVKQSSNRELQSSN